MSRPNVKYASLDSLWAAQRLQKQEDGWTASPVECAMFWGMLVLCSLGFWIFLLSLFL